MVRPGHDEITVTARGTCGIVLYLRDRDVSVPWPETRWAIEVVDVGETGRDLRGGPVDERGRYVTVSSPGRYRVTIPSVPGYASIFPFEVDVPEAQYVEHVVQLEPVNR